MKACCGALVTTVTSLPCALEAGHSEEGFTKTPCSRHYRPLEEAQWSPSILKLRNPRRAQRGRVCVVQGHRLVRDRDEDSTSGLTPGPVILMTPHPFCKLKQSLYLNMQITCTRKSSTHVKPCLKESTVSVSGISLLEIESGHFYFFLLLTVFSAFYSKNIYCLKYFFQCKRVPSYIIFLRQDLEMPLLEP